VDFNGIPPSDENAEKAALACVLNSEQSQAKAYFEQLQERHFYYFHNRAMFGALTRIGSDGRRLDAVTLCEQLREGGTLDEIGGTAMGISGTDNSLALGLQ